MGRIWAENVPDYGVRFLIEIPKHIERENVA